MSSPILALRAAIRAALLADPPLVTMLGGERLYDETPATVETPYITFGEANAADWSTGDARGHEHEFSLNVWSRQGGDSEALAILDRIAECVEETPLMLSGHHLVTLHILSQSVGRPSKDGLRRATIKFSAFTEISLAS